MTHVFESDLEGLKASFGLPPEAWSCHISLMEEYVVEGHVPSSVLTNLLDERPAVDAIVLPGMPAGSPGMGGTKDEVWTIFALVDGEVTEYQRF